jgi:hypothetical protein
VDPNPEPGRQKRPTRVKKSRKVLLEMLDVLFRGLAASPVAKKLFMQT